MGGWRGRSSGRKRNSRSWSVEELAVSAGRWLAIRTDRCSNVRSIYEKANRERVFIVSGKKKVEGNR